MPRYDLRQCANCGISLPTKRFKHPADPYCPKCMEASYTAPYWRDALAKDSLGGRALPANARDIRRALYEKQRGICAICKRGDAALVVDHDHDTGFVRGLLCNSCNNGLGNFRDDPDVLANARDYLLDSPAGRQRILYSDHKRMRGRRLKS